MTLDDVSVIIESISNIIQILAIIIAGIWTYILFIKNRQNYPKLQISHKVFERRIDKKKSLLHVVVALENKGNVLAKIANGEVRLLQVLPLIEEIKENVSNELDPVEQGTEIKWYLIGNRKINSHHEIEPGESEEIHCDFIVENEVTTMQIYSYFENTIKKNKNAIGWNCTSFHEMDSE